MDIARGIGGRQQWRRSRATHPRPMSNSSSSSSSEFKRGEEKISRHLNTRQPPQRERGSPSTREKHAQPSPLAGGRTCLSKGSNKERSSTFTPKHHHQSRRAAPKTDGRAKTKHHLKTMTWQWCSWACLLAGDPQRLPRPARLQPQEQKAPAGRGAEAQTGEQAPPGGKVAKPLAHRRGELRTHTQHHLVIHGVSLKNNYLREESYRGGEQERRHHAQQPSRQGGTEENQSCADGGHPSRSRQTHPQGHTSCYVGAHGTGRSGGTPGGRGGRLRGLHQTPGQRGDCRGEGRTHGSSRHPRPNRPQKRRVHHGPGDSATLQDDLLRLAQQLQIVVPAHDNLLGDIRGELPSQRPSSNSQELFEGYGDEMGHMQQLGGRAGEHHIQRPQTWTDLLQQIRGELNNMPLQCRHACVHQLICRLHHPGPDPAGDTEEGHGCAIQLLSVLEHEFPESCRTNGQCEADAIWLLLRGERLAEYIDGMNVPAEERVRGGEDEHPGLAGGYQHHEGNATNASKGRHPRHQGDDEDHPDDFEPTALTQSQLRGRPPTTTTTSPTTWEVACTTTSTTQ